jgi:hypothetical protein
MGKKQILKMIIDELKKTSDTEFLLTVYLFIKKFNARDDN